MSSKISSTRAMTVGLLLLTLGAAAWGADTTAQAVAKLRAGQTAQAVAELAALAKQQPNDLTAAYWLGRAYLQQGQAAQAAAQFNRIVAQKPQSADSWLWLGHAQAQQGEQMAAAQDFRKALELQPGNAEAQAALQALPLAAPAAQALAPRPGGALEPPLTWIGVQAQGINLPIEGVTVSSNRVYDYTFTGAPSDWVPRGGQWEQTFRWVCTPTWTWYGGHSEGVAATWNKRVFAGDVSVEAYMAFHMGLGNYSQYDNPNDMNLTLYGDGANLDSGYSFEGGGRAEHGHPHPEGHQGAGRVAR